MKTRQIAFCLLSSALLLTSCNKNPFERTKSSSGNGALGHFGAVGSMVIFSDELKTGGGAFEYPSGDNQVLAFNDRSNPLSERSIRYSWNGQPVSNPQNSGSVGNPEFIFVGFDLMHTTSITTYDATPARDLRAAGYNKVTFFARGSLSTYTVVKIEVAEPSSPAPTCLVLSPDGLGTDSPSSTCTRMSLTGSWQSYSIPITNAQLATVKDFFKATFVYNNPVIGNTQPGQGGTIYFDEIFYQP